MFFNPVFLWALFGLVLIGSEVFIPGFVIFFFGFGALLTSLLTALLPGLKTEYALQAVIWALSSGLTLGIFRKFFAKIFKGKVLKGGTDSEIGKRAVVVEKITPDSPGRIRYKGTTWKALSYTETFGEGETVEILKEEDLAFYVTRSIMEEIPDRSDGME